MICWYSQTSIGFFLSPIGTSVCLNLSTLLARVKAGFIEDVTRLSAVGKAFGIVLSGPLLESCSLAVVDLLDDVLTAGWMLFMS